MQSLSDSKSARKKAKARKVKRKANARFQAKIAGKKTKPLSRKRTVSQMDKIFSILIRTRDRLANNGLCVFGCGRPIECAFHFVTRSKYSTRWDETNTVGSCMSDNYTMEFNPHPYIHWYIKKYGVEAYENLVERSNKIAKFSTSDLREMLEHLKGQLAVAQTT